MIPCSEFVIIENKDHVALSTYNYCNILRNSLLIYRYFLLVNQVPTHMLRSKIGLSGESYIDHLLFVYRARGAVVSSTIWGVPPKIANASPPIDCEYNTFSTSVN